MKWQCPKHKVNLRTVVDYQGALVHNGCPEIFTVIDGSRTAIHTVVNAM